MTFPPLTPPPGIDDATSRALVRLATRWDVMGVERVLVMHVASTVESVLPHVADTFGLAGVRYVDVPPREFVQAAIAFMRTRGTKGALVAVLTSLGYPAAEIARGLGLKHDGTGKHDGTYLYGADSHWAVYRVTIDVDVDALPSLSTLRELWDGIMFASARRDRPVLVLRDQDTGDVVATYRSDPT